MLLRRLPGRLALGTVALLSAGTYWLSSDGDTSVNGDQNAEITYSLTPMTLGNIVTVATLSTHIEQTIEVTQAIEPVAMIAPAPLTPVSTSVLAEPDTMLRFSKTVNTDKGDTLAGLLTKAGVDSREAHAATTALGTYFNPRRIRPGHKFTILFERTPATSATKTSGQFMGLSFEPDIERRISVLRGGNDTFEATEESIPLTRVPEFTSGEITSSIYYDGVKAGLPVPVLVNLIRAFSWDVDFQRDIHPGDKFEVMFEGLFNDQNERVDHGEILFAALTLRGQRKAIYRHATIDGDAEYFDDKGRSSRKSLLRTPIDGARLSSGFGKRKHPILGYRKMHRGLDFAAPRGTPIFAAGDGVIEFSGRNGAYGKYIRIRHNGEYSTAYAHMKGFAKKSRKGKRVKQGQVIGYVGSTGRSTGPHLHYEILKAGRRVNPMRVKMPSGKKLAGAELERFLASRAQTIRTYSALTDKTKVASAQ